MKCLSIACCTLAALVVTTHLCAEPVTTAEGTKELCASAASKMAVNDPDAAYSVIVPHWPLPAEEIKELSTKTKSQLAMVASRFGLPIGHEYIETTAVGQSFIRHSYLVKLERHALRFMCMFYKPKDTWIVNGVKWDDRTDLLFTE